MMEKVIVPPRLVTIPRLGFGFSNSTGEKTLKYYNAPPDIKEGVIISSVSECGLMRLSGFECGDFLYKIGNASVSDFGEVWDVDRQVSRKLVDVFSGLDFGGKVVCGVLRGSSCVLLDFEYKEGGQGELRAPLGFLDTYSMRREVLDVRGVRLKAMRLSDVLSFNLTSYMGDAHAHKFRVLISNLDTHSDAYHAKSIRPGDILKAINKQPVPNTWIATKQVLDEHPEDQPLHLTTESGKVIII